MIDMNKTIVVEAGNHDRQNCPVSVLLPSVETSAVLLDQNGNKVACQLEQTQEGTVLSFLLGNLPAGQKAEFSLRTGEQAEQVPVAELSERQNAIDVTISGKPFTSYVYAGEDLARPYFFPVLAPSGAKVTRSFPMIEGVPGETTDHRHHRSMWIAHGSVNGVDNWSEQEGHGRTIHREFLTRISGPVYAKLATLNDWVGPDGKKILEQKSEFVFYNVVDGGNIMDVTVTFVATEGDVLFGDTKEGGIISVRMASSIDVPRGGRIVNSYGGIDEQETWGKKAHWCDYYGPTEGKVAGIAIFDHPENLRYPTNWHVRNYGLMTANCFGLSYFHRNKEIRGDYTLKAGQSLIFKYRVYVHDGSTQDASVAEKYHDFINPPTIQLE